MSDEYWHLKTAEEALRELGTSPEKGLSNEEAVLRAQRDGKNTLSQESSFRWVRTLLSKFDSLLIIILFGAGIIALSFNEIIEFIIIMVIILMTALLGFYQEYKADSTIKALNKLTAKHVLVLRDGKKKELPAEQLVVGDIVYLKRGDIIPADLRILEAQGLQIVESNITGESRERIKTSGRVEDENASYGDMDNMAFSSTHVICGQGTGVVVSTGMRTVIGKISASIKEIKPEKSPIQKKIDKMSKRISYIVLGIASLLLITLLLRGEHMYTSLLLVSAVAIAGIPESFPLALTLTFSNGIKKMARKNAIVKDLNSVETLGTATVICTDKTGTLTENKMRVSHLFLPEDEYTIKGKGYEPINTFLNKGKEVTGEKVKISEEFIRTLILCNESEIRHEEEEWVVEGEPTEGALLALAKSLDADEMLIKEEHKRVGIMPFDPSKKYMITANESNEKQHGIVLHMKGAGEIVLGACSHYRGSDNERKHLTPQMKHKITKRLEECNASGLRVLSIATKTLSKRSHKDLAKEHPEGYTFEGFVGIEDPIRPEVFDAVASCHKAGIKIVMITGDHKLIARNIGEKLGLFTHATSKILEGHEIERLSDEELDNTIMETAIFARTTPEHKLRIVDSFQRKGQIVAMTGDGVNDAPALKKADIGVSMGKNGTEVAREASNMVLADDNFATIVNAVSEGRTVYSNIRRFIYYLLTGNFTEVGMIFIAVIIGLPLPLTALMILFVNIVTSTIPALALSVEPTHEKVMRQKPRDPTERLLSGYLLTKITVLIPFLLLGTLGLFTWEFFIVEGTIEKAMTVAFATLITFELFHSFNARSLHTTIFDKDFFKNPRLFAAAGTSFILMLLAIYTPFGNRIFSTAPLTGGEWAVIIGASMSVIAFSEIIKYSIKSEIKEQSSLQGTKIMIE